MIVIFRILHMITPSLFELVDGDYLLWVDMIENGFFNLYDNTNDAYCPYLYYWFFYFYPLTLLPNEIGFFIWDGLRLTVIFYVLFKIDEIIKNDKNYFFWLAFTIIAFYFDQFLNNANFLILFFLFQSYRMLLKEKKGVASIYFFLAIFKINAIIYLLAILINKEIRVKDLFLYYIFPFICIMIPYFIIPNYLYQWLNNLGFFGCDLPSELDLINLIRLIIIVFWKMFQFSQWLFYAFVVGIFIEKQKDERKKFYIITYVIITILIGIILSITILFFPLY